MMWIVVPREPTPDKPYWPGRKWLAALDAIGWPTMAFTAVSHVPGASGHLGAHWVVVCVMVAMWRLRTAIWRNHRYRFVTWGLARVLAALIVVGLVAQFVLWLSK